MSLTNLGSLGPVEIHMPTLVFFCHLGHYLVSEFVEVERAHIPIECN